MNRIYLSGPMSGLPDRNFPIFNSVAARLRSLGFEVVNPTDFNPDGELWRSCLRRSISDLMTCDTIALLEGWSGSDGSFLELSIANRLGITAVNAQDLLTSSR